MAIVKVMANDSKIIVWFVDGNKMEVLFNELPLFDYADGNLTLKSNNTDISWPISQLSKFTIEKDTSSVTGICRIPSQQLNYSLDCCEVYDLSGKKITLKVRALMELPKGIYIIKKGSVTTKAIIK